jgi:hypothetical protein
MGRLLFCSIPLIIARTSRDIEEGDQDGGFDSPAS